MESLTWILRRTTLELLSTHVIFGIPLVGWEIPLVILGLVAFTALFVIRTTANLIAIGRALVHSRRAVLIPRIKEGVTILKPLKGVDKNLKANLESFLNMDYPQYEVLFSVDSPNDPAAAVVKELLLKYPKVDAQLVVSKPSGAENPKINNLLTTYALAKYDIMWQSDSNMIVEPHILIQLVNTLDLSKKYGIVHQLPLATNPESLMAQVEFLHLSTWNATMYLFLNYLVDTPCVLGKSLLFRKTVVEEMGGIAKYSNYLAEDYLFSQDFWAARFLLPITPDPSYQNLGNVTFLGFWARHVRWMRVRYSILPFLPPLEIFTSSAVNGFLSYHAMKVVFGIDPVHFLTFHFLYWMLTDVVQNGCFYGFGPKILLFFPAWIVREILAPFLTAHAALGDVVFWRGKYYRLSAGSALMTENKLKTL